MSEFWNGTKVSKNPIIEKYNFAYAYLFKNRTTKVSFQTFVCEKFGPFSDSLCTKLKTRATDAEINISSRIGSESSWARNKLGAVSIELVLDVSHYLIV